MFCANFCANCAKVCQKRSLRENFAPKKHGHFVETLNLLKLDFKGSDRLCKVVELSMQCCENLLSDSFETY